MPAGPNSGASTRKGQLLLCRFVTHCNSSFDICRSRGEGSECTMAFGGGVVHDSSLKGTTPKKHGSGQEAPPGATRPMQAVKRSLLRVRKRAQPNGWTFYKGKLLSLRDLGGQHEERTHPPASVQTGFVPPPPGGRRASLMTWNAGGLTSEIYTELVLWLRSQQVDIAMVQGTRWRGERTWRSHKYSFIQSRVDEGTQNVHCGLLTLISNRICSCDDIAFATINPGRLLHVRCRLGNNSMVLINIYSTLRHIPRNDQTEASRCQRQTLWERLDRLLHTLARRNLTVLAGDFHCPLQANGKTSCPTDLFDVLEMFAVMMPIRHSMVPKVRLILIRF